MPSSRSVPRIRCHRSAFGAGGRDLRTPPLAWHRGDAPVTGIFTAWLVLAAVGATAVCIDVTLALRRPDNRLRTALLGSIAWLVIGLAFTAVVRGLRGGGEAGQY